MTGRSDRDGTSLSGAAAQSMGREPQLAEKEPAIQRQRGAFLTRAILVVAVVLAAPGCGQNQPQAITVVSWGGSYGRAVDEGAIIPFTEATGIPVNVADYNGGLAEIRAQVDVGNIHWDVVSLEIADAVRACDEGLLEPIDISALPAGHDGTPAAEDFVPEAQTTCGAGFLYASTVYAYNEDYILGQKPATMADFFDLEKFPGRRGMRRVPQGNLEFALIADGVPPDRVYPTLSMPEGLERAFRKLDTIKDEVIWWEAGAQPQQLLADGEVVMSTAYNGRVFNARVLEGKPFVIVWDGQLLAVGQIGILRGTPRLEAALSYLGFATSAESLARIASRISYSPTRRSGMPLVTTHIPSGVEIGPHMPATPANAARAVHYDWSFWVDGQDELNERFSTWLAR